MLEKEINSQTEKVPQDAYWMISYLREDIQEIKQEMREIRNTILELHKTINKQQAWTIGTMIAIGGLVVALIKLL